MTESRNNNEFVSGLPPTDSPPVINPRGFDLLTRLRERAEADIVDLAPALSRRFDGERWSDPEPAAIEGTALAKATKQIVDFIAADKRLCASVTALLVRGMSR